MHPSQGFHSRASISLLQFVTESNTWVVIICYITIILFNIPLTLSSFCCSVHCILFTEGWQPMNLRSVPGYAWLIHAWVFLSITKQMHLNKSNEHVELFIVSVGSESVQKQGVKCFSYTLHFVHMSMLYSFNSCFTCSVVDHYYHNISNISDHWCL